MLSIYAIDPTHLSGNTPCTAIDTLKPAYVKTPRIIRKGNMLDSIANYPILDTMLSRLYMTLGEASVHLGIHRQTVRSLLQRGILTGEFFAGHWILDRKKVEELSKTYVSKSRRPEKKKRSQTKPDKDSLVAALYAWAEKWGYKEDT